MKISFELAAEFRDDQGKGASRRLRQTGKVPAILYGGGRESRSLSLDHTKLARVMEDERFYSTIISLKVGKDSQAAVLKDVQRHPYKPLVMHADFQRVLEDQAIRMIVPLHFTGESIAPGVKSSGGQVSHIRNEVEVECLPKHLPEFIGVDVSAMELNQVLHLSELKLPEGVQIVELIAGRDLTVVAIHAPRVEEVETPVVAEIAATAEGAAPAAGAAAAAPAADAKDAKKGDAKKPDAKKPDAKK